MSATKRLAWELGAIKKGAALLGSPTQVTSKAKNASEVEFPAVLLNTSSGKVEAEFQSYVKPSENPKLSSFCRKLTGITQDQVDAAESLETCLKMFDHWVKDLVLAKEFKFTSGTGRQWRDLYPKLCTFLTWSDWDLGRCLPSECRRKQLHYPHYLKQWIDIRATYKSFYNRKPMGVGGSLKDLGMTFQGRQHSGIDDARNTAFLTQRMIEDGCILEVTKSLSKGIRNRQPHFVFNKPISDQAHNGCYAMGNKAQLKESDTNSTLNQRTVGVKEVDTNNLQIGVPDVPLESFSVLQNASNEHLKGDVKITSEFDDSLLDQDLCRVDADDGVALCSTDKKVTGQQEGGQSSHLFIPVAVVRSAEELRKSFPTLTLVVRQWQTWS